MSVGAEMKVTVPTGRARVRLRRHPSTKSGFSMVTMTTPLEKETKKSPSDPQNQ